MILSFTGHRPQKIGGYSIPNPVYNYVNAELRKILKELTPEKAISGMAIGFDMWAAETCIDLNIPFVAAIPFKGQESRWIPETKKHYEYLLTKACEIVVVSPGEYAAWKMQARNKYMVDNSDLVVACFDGKPNGGTYNCVEYAKSAGKKIITIDPNQYTNI